MQAMTQGRDGISLAHARALELMGVARRFSLVAAMLFIAALVAGTAGTSYAGSKKSSVSRDKPRLEDTVVISNYGAVFNGSLETFLAGVGASAGPKLFVHGSNTNLGASTGAAQDAVSSIDNEIAVGIPIDFFGRDTAGCGLFGEPTTPPGPFYGTGLVELFSAGANGNSSPDNMVCSPGFAFGYPNTTGIFLPNGVAFEDPYDGVNPGTDIMAVANLFPEVNGSWDCPATDEYATTCILGACAPPNPLLPPSATNPPGASLGTITEYNRWTFTPGLNDVVPFNNSPVSAINPLTLAPYTQNATIAGCLSLLAGPESLNYDQYGYLFVVNNAGALAAALAAAPRYVTVYAPGATTEDGSEFPVTLIGLTGPTAGDLIQPIGAAITTAEINEGDGLFEGDAVYVTDLGDKGNPPRIQVFDPFTNSDPVDYFFDGELLATISGPHTKLKAPEGIAIDASEDAMYVVNNENNALLMYTDFPTVFTSPPESFDIPPTLTISGPHSKLNLPVGVALPAFTPTPAPSSTSTTEAVRD
jgi:hypothetical protein